MFEEESPHSFPEREESILQFWREHKSFLRSMEQRKGETAFTFYDGPPFATGLPHYGHLLAGTIKDVVPRYKTMKGFYVPRRFGWDCHGLPVEQEIEKAHNLSGAQSIEEFGIANFNEACRSIVLRYTEEWKATVERMGRWVSFDQTYRTMDITFMESVWWVFKQLYEKGLVYQGFRVTPFSAKLGTPLSNFEAGENYKEVDDPSLTVEMPLIDRPETSLLVWTTTPWTLPSNLAIAVGAEIDYVEIRAGGKQYILAKNRLSAYFKKAEEYEILRTFKGSALDGLRYKPLFDYFADHNAFWVMLGDFVSTEDGTGIVHQAPAFGENDFFLCQHHGIDLVCPVDTNGRFTEEVPEYKGMWVKDADKDIARRIKEMGRLFHQGTIRHRYPFCWRSDTPLIYRAVSTWLVAVERLKERLLAANEQIYWMPGHLKEGRFGKWLEGARDWNIGRNRYWGTPIPLWKSEDGDLLCIGSIAELEELTGKRIADIHRHHIDDLVILKNGKEYRRISEVFDCWFESGSMPYAQNHYPFEHKALTESNFPADFIAEGLDQTRCWFYTLTVLAVALFDKPAFKNVVVNGILLAEDGTKMSKRLKNYPEPTLVIDRYGADAVRLYMLNSPAVKADDLRFSERGVELVMRQVLLPLWNSYTFLTTYARIYDWKPTGDRNLPKRPIDRWILSRLHKLIRDVEEGMDAYDLSRAVEPFVGFIDQLTNWYIRLNRRRFWEEEDHDAFFTLYTVLLELSKVAAPFIPFLSEALYQRLRQEGSVESVHLCDYPSYDPSVRDLALEEEMALAETAVRLGHSLRKEHKVKVRQPLPAAHIASANKRALLFLEEQKELILSELNVKEIYFSEDEHQFVQLTAKPNFRLLGKKVGKLMPAVQKAVAGFGQHQLDLLAAGEKVAIQVNGEEIVLHPEEIEVERHVHPGMDAAHAGGITVVLDTRLNEELELEGLARELINKVSTMRREMALGYTDRIEIRLQTTERVERAFKAHQPMIAHELLAIDILFGPCDGAEWDLNGEPTRIEVKRA